MGRKRFSLVLTGILILAAAGLGVCFAVDDPYIAFDREAYDDLTVEYGEPIPENGISATYWSRVFHRRGKPLEVSVEHFPPSRPGEYTVHYSAAYRDVTAKGSYRVFIVDTTPPELIVGEWGDTYSSYDECDGDLTDAVVVETNGELVRLSVTDSSGNRAERTVIRDITPPVLTLGERLLDFTCIDDMDGDITDRVRYYESGGYLYYEVSDRRGNAAEASRRISGRDRVVYLTFDDGPGPYTEQLLDVLGRYHVKATFFVKGNSDRIDLLPRMAAEGHSIGAHTYSHVYAKVYASADAYFEDLAMVQRKIRELTGSETKLIRFPGGGSNTVSRTYSPGLMSELTRAVGERGYTYFDWNVSSGDAGAVTTSAAVLENVKQGVANHHVSVVLQHDIKDFSVAAVEDIVRWGQANGYVFLPLTERSTAPHHGVNN